MNQVLTVKEAAVRLHLSARAVRDLIAAEAIPCRRVGLGRGVLLLDEADVERYWEESKGASKPTAEGKEEVRMASRHLRPPSHARRRA